MRYGSGVIASRQLLCGSNSEILCGTNGTDTCPQAKVREACMVVVLLIDVGIWIQVTLWSMQHAVSMAVTSLKQLPVQFAFLVGFFFAANDRVSGCNLSHYMTCA